MAIVVLRAFDYKYADKDWRSEVEETYQLTVQKTTEYTVVDGQINRVKEFTWEFADPLAAASTDPINGTTYFFADNTWRVAPAYSFQATGVKTTTYEASGLNSYQVTVDDFSPLTGATTRTTSLAAGAGPPAPTINTALSGLISQTSFATLTDSCLDDFVDSKKALRFAWAETAEELARAARRAMQRDSAIIRTIKMPTNPLIKIGDTVRLVDPKRSLDALHLVTARAIANNLDTGDSTMTLTLEYWVR